MKNDSQKDSLKSLKIVPGPSLGTLGAPESPKVTKKLENDSKKEPKSQKTLKILSKFSDGDALIIIDRGKTSLYKASTICMYIYIYTHIYHRILVCANARGRLSPKAS